MQPLKLSEREREALCYLLSREADEMREGWQLAGIGEAQFLETLKAKLEAMQ